MCIIKIQMSKKNQETAVTLKSSKMTDSLLRLYHIFFPGYLTMYYCYFMMLRDYSRAPEVI